MLIHIHPPIALAKESEVRLANLIAGHSSLEKILRWCIEQIPPVRFEEMIQQDEFTSDVVVPFEDGLFLVYDVT